MGEDGVAGVDLDVDSGANSPQVRRGDVSLGAMVEEVYATVASAGHDELCCVEWLVGERL